jgi:hypothetical protein
VRESEIGRLGLGFVPYCGGFFNRLHLPDDYESLEPTFAVRWTAPMGNAVEITAMISRVCSTCSGVPEGPATPLAERPTVEVLRLPWLVQPFQVSTST